MLPGLPQPAQWNIPPKVGEGWLELRDANISEAFDSLLGAADVAGCRICIFEGENGCICAAEVYCCPSADDDIEVRKGLAAPVGLPSWGLDGTGIFATVACSRPRFIY